MYEKAVVYGPMERLSPDFVGKMALLYDRVVVPLGDSIRSRKIQWLSDLEESCSFTKDFMNKFAVLYDDNCGVCRPLDGYEYPSLNLDSDEFAHRATSPIRDQFSNHEIDRMSEKAINVLQNMVNFFVSRDYIEESGGGNVIFPYRVPNETSTNRVKLLSEILQVEAVRCALGDIKMPIDRKHFESLMKISRTLDSRHNLRRYLEEKARQLETIFQSSDSREEKKRQLRETACEMAEQYHMYLRDLEKYGKYIRIERGRGSNTLLIARKFIKPKPRLGAVKLGLEGYGFIEAMFNLPEKEDAYRQMWMELEPDQKKIDTLVQYSWQNDLLGFQCDMDREFGRQEMYKKLRETTYIVRWMPYLSRIFE